MLLSANLVQYIIRSKKSGLTKVCCVGWVQNILLSYYEEGFYYLKRKELVQFRYIKNHLLQTNANTMFSKNQYIFAQIALKWKIDNGFDKSEVSLHSNEATMGLLSKKMPRNQNIHLNTRMLSVNHTR